MREKIAALISFTFDPTITFPLFLLIIIFKAHLSNSELQVTLPLIFFTAVILPAVFWFLSLKNRWISDWEISKRGERFNLYSIFCFFWILGVLVAHFFGNAILTNLFLIFTIAFLIATLITWFWKISIHMLIDTVIINILDFVFGGFWYFYLLLPVLAWSRYVRHKHTPAQLLGGFSLAMAVVFLSFKILGFI